MNHISLCHIVLSHSYIKDSTILNTNVLCHNHLYVLNSHNKDVSKTSKVFVKVNNINLDINTISTHESLNLDKKQP